MKEEHRRLIEAIAALPDDWHGAGSVNRDVLDVLAEQCRRIGAIKHSVETGAGRTTLLLSHLSENHLVFAKDCERSMSQARASSLLRAEHVEFIEGPTQRTLPTYQFKHRLQVALLDGPHGYPFPDMEYYYLYPHLEYGGLLVLDDIGIPSIGRMFSILKADAMFDLAEVVHDTAFLIRTDAPAIDPCSDSWWLQGFNRSYYDLIASEKSGASLSARLLHRLATVTPKVVKSAIPQRLQWALRRRMYTSATEPPEAQR